MSEFYNWSGFLVFTTYPLLYPENRCSRTISSTCLGTPFPCKNALALNFYFLNIFTLNFIHYFELKVSPTFTMYAIPKKRKEKDLLVQKLLIKWWLNWPQVFEDCCDGNKKKTLDRRQRQTWKHLFAKSHSNSQ